ncbi:hypothetical protein [Actinomadura chokoriensis]|uniref:hypothetical protein n=1 Tax=Actinomadura chokoriensis TaxID=454156 RepID=UPI0031F798A9
MPKPARTPAAVLAAAALSAALLTSAAAPANARERAAAPEGKIIVFVTEGAEIAWAGTKLREYPASAKCQALPPGAHVVANYGTTRLLFFTDPFCLFPVPPPFNFISPGYGAHVSPTGSFRAG